MTKLRLLPGLAAGLALVAAPAAAAPEFRNVIVTPGDATDLFPTAAPGANTNRLGGTFSDLYYDRSTGSTLSLPDRGPGGGTISYDTRVERFSLGVDPVTGAISNLQLTATTPLTAAGRAFNGLNPALLNGNASALGRSLDPEGFAVARNGNYYVADEYGPSVLEFTPAGALVRTFTAPANLLPRRADDALDFVAGRPLVTTGRQDNRGYEGVTVSPDGSKLYAVLQGPLVDEGSADGRFSRNVRIVEYDTATGQPGRQLIYQLDAVADLNALVPDNPFAANAQGRSIGISAIVALNDTEFLILERDNRGVGVDDPTGSTPVASKRVYRISIAGATDVSGVSLIGANALPPGVIPVSKTLFLDVAAALRTAGLAIPEKLEGLTVGPRLNDGSYALLLGTDNDFSTTQNASGVQFDVCVGGGATAQVPLNGACPAGLALIPTYLYAFRAELPGFAAPTYVPEPTSLLLLGVGLAAAGATRRRR